MRKRLLFVLHSLEIGGAERLALQMLPELTKRYDVGILCLDRKGTLWSQAEQFPVELFCADRPPGVRLKTILKTAGVIREFRPDLIHAHQYTPWFYSGFGKLLAGGSAQLLFTEHGRHFPDIVSTKRRVVNKLLLWETAAFTAVSEATKAQLAANEGLPVERIAVIRNAISPLTAERASLRAELGLDEKTKLIGFVGSLKPVKNPLLLVNAFKILLEQTTDDVHLLYLGDGALRGELEQRIRELGLIHRIHLLGARIPVEPYLHELDVFALPSLSEGISLAMLEAISAGVIVVASRVGGNPEVIIDGQTGYLFASGDAAGLAQKLTLALQGGSALRENAKELLHREFSFPNMLERYLSLYESLVQKS